MNVLVTGGSRGIGLAMVKALRSVGHKVAVAARHENGIDSDLFIGADLSKRNERHGIIQKTIDCLGGLDVLVNNAGDQVFQSATDYSVSNWEHSLALMLTAPFELSQQAAKHMLKNGGGHIVNVLSTSAFQGARNISGYVAAKHGLLGVTRAMAIEFAPLIHVNAIAPGLTETDMTEQYISPERKTFLESITPARRFCQPEEIAYVLMFLINSTVMYGQTIVADGGWLSKNG